MRYTDVSQKERKFLDLTSLTVEEFEQLVPALRALGETPARSMEQLAQRLSSHTLPDISSFMSDASSTDIKHEKHDPSDQPFFAMIGRNNASSAPKIRMNSEPGAGTRIEVSLPY